MSFFADVNKNMLQEFSDNFRLVLAIAFSNGRITIIGIPRTIKFVSDIIQFLQKSL